MEISYQCGGKCCQQFTLRRDIIWHLWADRKDSEDCIKVREMLIAIKEPQPLENLLKNPSNHKDAVYFTCKHLKEGLCSNYENRPQMCRNFPAYYQSVWSCPYKDCACSSETFFYLENFTK